MRITYGPEIFHQRFGGISRYFVRVASELKKLGQDVEILAPIHSNSYLRQSATLGGKRLFWPARSEPSRRFVGGLARAQVLSRVVHDPPDLYHPTYYSGRFPRVPIPKVLTVFDLIHELGFLGQAASVRGTIRKKSRMISEADLLFVISESTKADLLALYDVDPAKVVVTPLGVDAHEFDQSLSPDGKPFLLYVGNRRGYKNFRVLARALRLLRQESGYEVGLILAGGEVLSKDERETLSSSVGDQNLWCQVFPSDDQLADLYQSAIALVCTSVYEGFGLPVLEGMARGCPVLCSNTSSLPEVGGAAPLYFSPDDFETLAKLAATVISDGALRARLSRAGFEQASRFSWRDTAESTLRHYQGLQQ